MTKLTKEEASSFQGYIPIYEPPWNQGEAYEPEPLEVRSGIFQHPRDVSRWWPVAVILVVGGLVLRLVL